MRNEHKYIVAYVVIRVEEGPLDQPARIHEHESNDEIVPAPGPSNVKIKEIVMSAEEARNEVRRLNQLNAEKGCTYYWQSTHLFIEGGSHGSGERLVGENKEGA
jgi:hypothetical protein